MSGPGAALAAAILLAGVEQPPDPGFEQGWRSWHAERLERLRRPDGWLALVGLHWLGEGENRIPGLPGAFTVAAGKVTLTATAADGYRLDGAPVTSRTLASDRAPRPDRLVLGSRQVQVIERSGRLAVRVWDAESPLRKGFQGIETFPPDPRWRIVAEWEAYPAPRAVTVPSVTGSPSSEEAPGRARFTLGGRAFSLEPTLEEGALFFVFKDETARTETYGAGRFLVADLPRDGKVVLDFNRAYNPPCAFTAFATCPLPRPENVLPVRIEAGEKRITVEH
jgi:uncharacterized protein (DUF1684 family)